ncbi:flagellar biosynthesis protein FlaG [Clostridium beijerinckii]|uniref:Flagellar biosynthesis protein FlaG n=1 Tax=Clostridium beijerinckii TaxID=1520 RepID=A0A0B5QK92_CLOBE|nr:MULTISPECIES: flagellar protein FlaG [Clostridium]AJH01346.1 flagellar biosynthesis protein FlaG [Clostridium beijerinckii]OVE70746.1 flagellar biosynthesis protein FlaG [Clostridium diolis]
MDVNNINQNSVNFSNYQNSNISEYVGNSIEVSTQQVQKVETQNQQVNNSDTNKQYDKKELDEALKKINNFLKDDKTHAEYTYNKEMKTMMVKIIDENTKEVVLEIPPKKILDMVASMMRQVGLLDKKA